MDLSSSELGILNDKIRQQYDFLPYPESDIEYSPKDKLPSLFIHSLAIPYYLRYQKVIDTKGKIILDAGCGSGLQSLSLALANPGAKIVGVDISSKSIDLARQRLAHHGIKNVEFHTLSLDDIESLGYQYDYINCDEVLYLLPNPKETLKLFEKILKPGGIIRTNLHSHYQRNGFFRSQEAFRQLGLFDEDSTDTAIEVVQETLENLKDAVKLKELWNGFEKSAKPTDKHKQVWILVNYLLQGDKGYTIEELFDFLDYADLDFLSMVNWRQWDLGSLFKDPDELPMFWQWGLEEATEQQKLQLFELFHPVHRLLDFWAVKKDNTIIPDTPLSWSDEQWLSARVYLNPVLATDKVKNDLLEIVKNRGHFEISSYIPLPTLVPIMVDDMMGACLLPLWESAQSFGALVERWLMIQPRNPETLELKTNREAMGEIQELLSKLETFTYVMLEL